MALGDALIGLAGFAGGGKRRKGGSQVDKVVARFIAGLPGEAMKGRVSTDGSALRIDGQVFAQKAGPESGDVEVCFTRNIRTDAGKAAAQSMLRKLEAGIGIGHHRGPKIGPASGDWRFTGRKGGKETLRVPEGCVSFSMTAGMVKAAVGHNVKGTKAIAQAAKARATRLAREEAAFEKQFGVPRNVFNEAMSIAQSRVGARTAFESQAEAIERNVDAEFGRADLDI